MGTVNSFLVCWGSSWTVARRLVRMLCEGSGGRYPCTATASAAMHACGRMALAAAPRLQCLVLSKRCELLAAIGVPRAQHCYCMHWSTCAQLLPAGACLRKPAAVVFWACANTSALAVCKTLACALTAPQGGATPVAGGEPSSACRIASLWSLKWLAAPRASQVGRRDF